MSLSIQQPDVSIMKLLEREFSTLCNTCDHFNACSYQDDEKGIIQCELFENESGIFIASIANAGNVNENAAPPVGVKGICVNCDRVWDCKLPKAPAGVWHCEEYE